MNGLQPPSNFPDTVLSFSSEKNSIESKRLFSARHKNTAAKHKKIEPPRMSRYFLSFFALRPRQKEREGGDQIYRDTRLGAKKLLRAQTRRGSRLFKELTERTRRHISIEYYYGGVIPRRKNSNLRYFLPMGTANEK